MIWTSLLTPRPLSTCITLTFYKRDVFIIHSTRRLRRKNIQNINRNRYDHKILFCQFEKSLQMVKGRLHLYRQMPAFKQMWCQQNRQAMTICAWKCCILQTTSLWCLIDLFGMLRWKSSAEISEHSTKQQKPESDRRPDIRSVACDIWSPDLRGERAHLCTHVRTRTRSEACGATTD